MLTFWGPRRLRGQKDHRVFAEREDAEKMLCDCLSDEPDWASILEVVPVELEFSAN